MLQRLARLLRLLNILVGLYCAAAAFALMYPLSILALLLVAWLLWRSRRPGRPTDLGSARWAERPDLDRAGMIGANRGLILGRLPRPRWSGGSPVRPHDPLVRLPQAVHIAIFAPTGAGKGVSFVLPELFTNPESMVVLDFKGDLATQAAEYRRKRFGHRVVLLDPYRRTTQQPDTLNVLDFIRKGDPLAIDDCNDLASAIVVRTGFERERHWDDSAEAVIAAMLSTVVHYGEPQTRSLRNVREILSHPKRFDMAVQLAVESDAWSGALSDMAGQLLHFEGKEKASVISSSLRHLKFLGTPAIADSVATSTFDPAELRRGRMTVFCTIPPDRAHAQAGLLRMWIGAMLKACVQGGLQ